MTLPSRRFVAATLLGVAVAGYFFWPTTKPADLLRQGELAVGERAWVRAESFASRLEEAGEPDAAALLRARSFGAQGRNEAVLQSLRSVPADSPFSAESARMAGMALLGLGRPRDAEKYLRHAFDADPNQADVRRGLGVIAYDQGRLAEAVEHLEAVAALDAADGRSLRLVGLIHHDLDRPAEAIAAYERALKRDIPPAMRDEVRLEMAGDHIKRQQYEMASATLDEASPGATASPTAAGLRGDIAVATLAAPDASNRIDSLLQSHPKQTDLLRLRGQLHRTLGEHAKAVEVLKRASAIDPHDYRIAYELAQSYESAGDKEKAAEAKSRVEAIQADLTRMTNLSLEAMNKPDDAAVRRRLAEVAERLGNRELAERWRTAADEIDGN